MGGSEGKIEDIGRYVQRYLPVDNIVKDASGSNLEDISGQAQTMHDNYLETMAHGKWQNDMTIDITKKLKPQIQVWAERTERQTPNLEDINAVTNLMADGMRLEFLTIYDYNALVNIPLFDSYIQLINEYVRRVNELYDRLADLCRHYYRGTTTAELDFRLVSREKWTEYYPYGYCCLTSVPVAALDYSFKNQKPGEEILVLRYSKDLASEYVERPGHGLSDNVENDINKPAKLYLMYEMELRLRTTADPTRLGMEIISFERDSQKQKALTERYGGLGRIIFANHDVGEIL